MVGTWHLSRANGLGRRVLHMNSWSKPIGFFPDDHMGWRMYFLQDLCPFSCLRNTHPVLFLEGRIKTPSPFFFQGKTWPRKTWAHQNVSGLSVPHQAQAVSGEAPEGLEVVVLTAVVAYVATQSTCGIWGLAMILRRWFYSGIAVGHASLPAVTITKSWNTL